ncbi:hypothetical protein ACOSQ3_031874 [Xanthoceras sorbifolium]
MLAQVGRIKTYKKKYLYIDPQKPSKERYNLYGFVWSLQDVVHERLEPSDIEVTQSYYEGLMDVPDLFSQNASFPNRGGIDDVHACIDPDPTPVSPPPPSGLETSLMRLEQKLMDVDARLQVFITESPEIERRRDEQYDLIMS